MILKEDVKSLVRPEDVLEHFGHPVKSKNKNTTCPFHEDRVPSMKIYDDGGFRCFSCHRYGDIIDLVRCFIGNDLSMPEILTYLNDEFQLGLEADSPERKERAKKLLDLRKDRYEKIKACEEKLEKLCDLMHTLNQLEFVYDRRISELEESISQSVKLQKNYEATYNSHFFEKFSESPEGEKFFDLKADLYRLRSEREGVLWDKDNLQSMIHQQRVVVNEMKKPVSA